MCPADFINSRFHFISILEPLLPSRRASSCIRLSICVQLKQKETQSRFEKKEKLKFVVGRLSYVLSSSLSINFQDGKWNLATSRVRASRTRNLRGWFLRFLAHFHFLWSNDIWKYAISLFLKLIIQFQSYLTPSKYRFSMKNVFHVARRRRSARRPKYKLKIDLSPPWAHEIFETMEDLNVHHSNSIILAIYIEIAFLCSISTILIPWRFYKKSQNNRNCCEFTVKSGRLALSSFLCRWKMLIKGLIFFRLNNFIG